MRPRIEILAVGLLCSLLVLPGPHAQTKHQKTQPPLYEDRDGYEVLSVLLNTGIDIWKNETVRIHPLTPSGKYLAEIKAQCSVIPAEFQTASEDFDKQIRTRFLLRQRFSLKKTYQLAAPVAASPPTDEDKALSKAEFGRLIRERIRSGTYYVAAVGFDDKRTRAVAFVEYICGNLCGDSMFYFLRKSEKGWEEARDVKVTDCGRIY